MSKRKGNALKTLIDAGLVRDGEVLRYKVRRSSSPHPLFGAPAALLLLCCFRVWLDFFPQITVGGMQRRPRGASAPQSSLRAALGGGLETLWSVLHPGLGRWVAWLATQRPLGGEGPSGGMGALQQSWGLWSFWGGGVG